MSPHQPTATRLIGYYKKRNTTAGTDITVQEFLDGIATGKWQKHVDWVREAQDDKAEYDRRKTLSECVTISGTFDGAKTKENLREASGLMAVDLDALLERVESFRQLLSQVPYVYAVFKSIGGRGLCPIFRIDPARWDDSFAGISDYLITTYGLVGKQFDPSSSNINRLRYVSYDPDIYVNEKAKLFAKYPRKEKPKKTGIPEQWKGTQSDIQHIIDQLNARALDITGSYNDWYRIGWSLISEYGEEARYLFQQVSQYHPDYDAEECDRKFRYLVATRPSQIRIATFYWYCKQAGLDIMTPRTKEIVSVAAMGKKQKISQASTIDMVGKQLGVPAAEAAPIVEQLYAASEAIDTQETIFDQLELFLRTNYTLRYNEVTHVFEDQHGREQEEADFYAMYISARKVVSDKLRFADFQMLIFSHTIFPKVHPIKDFFTQHRHRRPTGVIDQLIASIETDTGFTDAHFSPRFSGNYIRKWLIGLIETLYGNPCAIALFLTGAPNSGKTSWFRQLLPAELATYRYETKWADNRDEYVRMCTHWLSFYDEFRTGDATSVEHFKNLTTKDYFTVRLPFGKKDVRLQRLAVLCATSNAKNVINEPEFNRRVIPINVLRVDWAIYNGIDRIDLLLEAYHAYQAGERSTLTAEEIGDLRELTEEFQNKTIEQQLIDQHLAVPTDKGAEVIEFLSTTDIMSRLELRVNNRKLNLNHIGSAMQAAGFERKNKKVAGKSVKGYRVILLD